jgi:hypothetical protein
MIERVIQTLKDRRNRVLQGEINCIPFTFSRFTKDLPGIEKDKYYLISGSPKAGKSQIANFMFLYTPILYAYHNPDKVRVKIFYFPLEETPENITLRFMSYLLYTMSDIRIAPIDLKSTNSEKVLPEEILNALESNEYQEILKFYEENVLFLSDRNPTGIFKTLLKYAESTGTVHKKIVNITNKETGLVEKREVFDYYEPNDPKEYVVVITDHVSLLESERGFTLRETINKFSEYMMILRNKYHYIPVVIQQQSTETNSLEAFKNSKIRPTMAGLSDSKYTAKDASVMLGITNPYAFELPEYLGYDITKLRGNVRFLEIVLNREGESNGVVGLYFDGATNYFNELPLPGNRKEMEKVYGYINNIIRGKTNPVFILLSRGKTKIVKDLRNRKLFSKFANLFNQ